MEVLKTLYKTTSNGKTQYWRQEISSDGCSYRTATGKLGGAEILSAWTQCYPKNVGKTNETTAIEQCRSEVESNYKKKLNQGNYKESLDEGSLSKDNFIKPMLAHTFGKQYTPTEEDFSNDRVYSQPKLDGVRCLVTKDGMFSRQGKPIPGAPHIHAALKPVFSVNTDLVIDGELYTDKLSDNFNKILSLVRNATPNKEELAESEANIEYWVYDIISDTPFMDRCSKVNSIPSLLSLSAPIRIVPTIIAFSATDLDDIYQYYLEKGYEGQMVRISSKGYESKRSKQLLKRKEFVDEEFTIIDIDEGIGNRAGTAGSVKCVTKNGSVFSAGIRGNIEFFEHLLNQKDQYLGTIVTIRYQNLTPDGIPRFGVATKFLRTKEREV